MNPIYVEVNIEAGRASNGRNGWRNTEAVIVYTHGDNNENVGISAVTDSGKQQELEINLKPTEMDELCLQWLQARGHYIGKLTQADKPDETVILEVTPAEIFNAIRY